MQDQNNKVPVNGSPLLSDEAAMLTQMQNRFSAAPGQSVGYSCLFGSNLGVDVKILHKPHPSPWSPEVVGSYNNGCDLDGITKADSAVSLLDKVFLFQRLERLLATVPGVFGGRWPRVLLQFLKMRIASQCELTWGQAASAQLEEVLGEASFQVPIYFQPSQSPAHTRRLVAKWSGRVEEVHDDHLIVSLRNDATGQEKQAIIQRDKIKNCHRPVRGQRLHRLVYQRIDVFCGIPQPSEQAETILLPVLPPEPGDIERLQKLAVEWERTAGSGPILDEDT